MKARFKEHNYCGRNPREREYQLCADYETVFPEEIGYSSKYSGFWCFFFSISEYR